MPPDTEPALVQCDPQCSGSNDEVALAQIFKTIMLMLIMLMLIIHILIMHMIMMIKVQAMS